MTAELSLHLKALSRLIYFVTDEEDRFLLNFKNEINKKYSARTWVFNYTMGIQPLDEVIADWANHKHETKSGDKLEPNKVLEGIFKDDPHNEQNFYIFLDPERIFRDEHLTRRVLNIVHSLHNDIATIKILIFAGPRRAIPEKLSRYMEVVYDTGLSDQEIETLVNSTCSKLVTPEITVKPPEDAVRLFQGMTSWEISAAISQSIATTKRHPDPKKRFQIDPHIISAYRRRALKKTELLQYVDTDEFSFEQVGGVSRFKEWARETAPSWTPAGRAFGLRPPKGVMAVGVWGCGKSLSVKAMGKAWGLPVIQLETGKLRSSQQGASEANVYAAIHMIERVSPCIVWIDEAEKSLSGGGSSDQTDSGTTSRMIGILSTWLQETKKPVCLALTANSLRTLPIEFINRVDERFFFDMPSKKERVEILKIHLKRAGQNPERFDLDALAVASEMMVGREIEQAVGAAMTKSFNDKHPALDFDLLKKVLIKKPRLSKTMVDEVDALVKWVGYDAEADDGIRARYASPPTRKNDAPALSVV